MALDDDNGVCGGAPCLASFRSQVLLTALFYLGLFGTSLAALASSAVSDEALGFAIVTGVVSPSVHLLFTLLGLLSPSNAKRVAQLDALGLVWVGDLILAGALGVAATSISLQGVHNDPAQRPYGLVANALIMAGQLGAAAKIAEWTDASKYDQADGSRLDAGDF